MWLLGDVDSVDVQQVVCGWLSYDVVGVIGVCCVLDDVADSCTLFLIADAR
jgi:hypothetical protein